MSWRRVVLVGALTLVGAGSVFLLVLPRPLSCRVMELRCASFRQAGERGHAWLTDGTLDREFTHQLVEVARSDEDTEMRRKCLTVLGLAREKFPIEVAAGCRTLLLDEEPFVVAQSIPLLGEPLRPCDAHLLIGIWREDAHPVQAEVVIALARSENRLMWYARLLNSHEVSDPDVREILWKKLRAVGCEVEYGMNDPEESKKWRGVLEWLKERTPGEWK